MKRLHLFELEDHDFVPAAIRNGGTDLLDFAFAKAGFYDGVANELVRVLEATHETEVLDVCSGGGGGVLALRAAVRRAGKSTRFVLTDLHPNEAGAERVRALGDEATEYLREPVDATAVPVDRPGVRTMSGALHHFPPESVRTVVSRLVASRRPLAFFDVAASPGLRRAPLAVLPLAFTLNFSTLFVVAMLVVPFVRPFRLTRALLTYVIPAIPFLFAWDGTVSALRAYTPEEVLALARSVPGADAYTFASGVAGKALYLTGIPKPA